MVYWIKWLQYFERIIHNDVFKNLISYGGQTLQQTNNQCMTQNPQLIVCVIHKAIKIYPAVIWFNLFNFSGSVACSSYRISLQSVRQKHTTVYSDSRNRKQQCMQPGNGLPSERTGGPVKKWNNISLGRQWKGYSLQRIWSLNSIVQWLSTGSMPMNVRHSCQKEL